MSTVVLVFREPAGVDVALTCAHGWRLPSTTLAAGDAVDCDKCDGLCRDCHRAPAVHLGRCPACDADYVESHREQSRQDAVNSAEARRRCA